MGLPPILLAVSLPYFTLCVFPCLVSCGCNDGVSRKDRFTQVVLASLTKQWSSKRTGGRKSRLEKGRKQERRGGRDVDGEGDKTRREGIQALQALTIINNRMVSRKAGPSLHGCCLSSNCSHRPTNKCPFATPRKHGPNVVSR